MNDWFWFCAHRSRISGLFWLRWIPQYFNYRHPSVYETP